METKLFEVRDRLTFIPVICIKFNPASEEERYLLAMAGYGTSFLDQSRYVLMAKVNELNFVDAPACHPGYPVVRTLPEAHKHVMKNWDQLRTGDVIDVEFICGERTEPRKSQRVDQC